MCPKVGRERALSDGKDEWERLAPSLIRRCSPPSPGGRRTTYSTVTRLRLSPELRSTSLLYGSMPASYGSSSSTSSMVLSVPVMWCFSRYSTFSSDSSRSEEHTSELQSLMRISYAVFCLKKKKQQLSKTICTKKQQ